MLSPSEANRLTLNGLLSVIRRRRFALLAPIAICFFLAVLVCIFMTRMYKATGEIQIARANSDGLGLDSMLSPTDISPDALSESLSLQTQATILKSDTLALQVIENLNLEHNADFQPTWNPLG